MKTGILVAVAVGALVTHCALAQAPDAAPAGSPNPPISLSPAAAEVVKLASAGTGEDVQIAYVQNSQSAFNLSADDILYLKDIGVSSQVITAMLNRDAALKNQAPPTYAPGPAAPAPAPAPGPETAVTAPATPPPDYVGNPPADVSYFYGGLAPYGTWVVLPSYGWCWQPTVVVLNRGWRPYCDHGYWVYSDAGWYWASDYSWGWAPFHYGRWVRHDRCGWVWVPDRVWGPAWVTWRTAGNNCGWAPLPPHAVFQAGIGWSFNGVRVGIGFDFGVHSDCFTFVALGDFCSHDVVHHCLPPAHVTKIYNQTTVINNYTVVNKTVVNHGVQVDRVAAATHTQIRKAALLDLPAGSHEVARSGAADRNAAVVYRTQPKAPTRPVNMMAQKVDERNPVIHHAAIERPASRVVPHGGAPPISTPRKTQPDVQKTPAPPGSDRSAPGSLRTYPPPPTTAPTKPSGGDGSKSSGRSPAPSAMAFATPSTPTTRSYEQPKPAPQADSAVGTATAPRSESSRRVQPAPESIPASRPPTGPGVYYPKTYQQVAEVRSLPAQGAQQDNRASSPGKDHNADAGSQSKKSDSGR